MKLQTKILIPIFTMLILSFLITGIISAFSTRNIESDVMNQMDEKNIALAQTLAFMIEEDENKLEYDKMVRLARLFGVDEVHVTDENGILLWGNVIDFYGFDFSTSDQTRPLLAILRTPSLAIAQEPQPRGSDGVMFQYVSVARTDKKGIVQIGVSMETVQKIRNVGNNALLTIVFFGSAATLLSSLIIFFIVKKTITNPLAGIQMMAENVAKGNLNINIDTSSKDETGMLAKSFKEMIAVINMLINAINEMGRSYQIDGDIEAKIDGSRFDGSYRDVADSINNLMDNLVNEIIKFFDCLTKFNDGNFSADMPKLPGKKIVMNNALDNMRNNLNAVNKDISTLVFNAINGELSNKVDVNVYKGDWAVLMNELNRLMEAIIAPIKEASEVLGYVSAGDFNHMMNGSYKGDFHEIKESINTTVTNIASYINEISGVLNALANNDLNQDIKREYVGKFLDIKTALLKIIAEFNIIISSISSASDQVDSGAKMVSESSMKLATGATEQASSIEELNATIQTINENTLQNADKAKTADELSDKLKINAEKGNNDMSHMLEAINSIKDSSDKISKIIKFIEDIALQTNLLALNAAVEAARAGVHGKGFSVVAEEVRNLAQKTAVSAKDTAELIEESINRVNDGTEIAGKTGETLKTIVDEVTMVADIIKYITNSTEEQAVGIVQVMNGVNQITDVVQDNAASAEEAASASQELASQSEVLKNMIGVFKLKSVDY